MAFTKTAKGKRAAAHHKSKLEREKKAKKGKKFNVIKATDGKGMRSRRRMAGKALGK